jgi:hypothetical protein
MMGSALGEETGPKKCFNAANNAQLGWYDEQRANHRAVADGGVRIEVAAFVDSTKASGNQPVLVDLE